MTGNTWIIIGVLACAFAAFAIPYGFHRKSKEKSSTGMHITGDYVTGTKVTSEGEYVAGNKSGNIEQIATGNHSIQAATSGDNSPIIMDNRKKVIDHKIIAKVLSFNKPEGDFYVTKVELYSQHTIPNLYVAAHAQSIVGFSVMPQRAGVHMTGHSGKREGFSFTNLPNFGGKYLMVIRTREPEKITVEYN